MPQIARATVVDPYALDAAEQTRLVDAMYEIYLDQYSGMTRDAFLDEVVASSADRTFVRCLEDADGELLGFVCQQFRKQWLNERDHWIGFTWASLRGELHKGGGLPAFVSRHMLAVPPEIGADPAWLVLAVSHPARFQALTRSAPGMWPRVGEELPKMVESFLIQTADNMHLRVVDSARPLVRETGWVIRARPIERAYWSGSSHPAARFFTDANPHFDEGCGLMVVVPVGRSVVSFDGVADDRPQGRDRFKLFQTGAKKLVAGKPNTLTAEEAEALIADAAVLRGTSPETANHLLQVGTRRSVKAGATVFEQGDKPGPMVLVLDGDASVSLDVGDTRLLVAELGPGSLVGEMSLLTGERRSATLVASSDLQLLQVDHDGLREVGATDPGLLDRLWRNTGEHLIDNLLRGATPFAGWTAAQRRTWWNAGSDVDLQPGATMRIRAGALFVYQGEVHVEQPDGFSLLRAPGLISIDASARLRSPPGARARLLPALRSK